MVASLRKTVQKFFKKLKAELTYDPAISLGNQGILVLGPPVDTKIYRCANSFIINDIIFAYNYT
jgi:hypothetical protein